MNILSMGVPMGADQAPLRLFRSDRHQIRTLSTTEDSNYRFDVGETAVQILERIHRRWPVDMWICWLPEYYPPPPGFESLPIRTVAAISDWNLYYPALDLNLARYDVALTDRLGASQLRAPGAMLRYVTPLYSHRRAIHRPMAVERNLDVVFIGNLNHHIHAERGRYLERLAKLADRRKIHIAYGEFGDDYVRLLSRAKIVFNHSVRREMNMRCFEAMGCGAMLFVESGNLEAQDFLRDGQDAVFYREDNFVELIEHFLDEDAAREQIADQGLQRSAELAGEFRLGQIFDAIEVMPRGERTFHAFDDVTKRLANVMQYLQSQTPGHAAIADRELEAGLTSHPDRIEFQLAAGLREFYQAPAEVGPEREQSLAAAARRFRSAARIDSSSAVSWFNLARTLGVAGDMQTEFDALQQVLHSRSIQQGSLLLMRLDDPYYTAWMKVVATGSAAVELLQSAAACRMAEILLSIDRIDDAKQCAQIAVALIDEISTPFRLLALTQEKLGRADEAAQLLEQSLPLSPLDNRHRLELIRIWSTMGKKDCARALAAESATILSAFPGAELLVEHFRRLADEL